MTNFILKNLIILAFSISTYAATLKSEGKVHTQIKDSEITVTTDKGFHLNKDAPADLVVDGSKNKIPPKKKTETEISFAVPTNSISGVVNVYACDDAKTVCEPHALNVKWGNSVTPVAAQAPTKEVIQNASFQKALQAASKSNKLVLVDFAARWCPPCIRLENEVFNTKEFKSLKNKYVFITVDVDKEENFPLMKEYFVKAFPTLVVVNSKGQEIERFLDFQQAKPFVADLNRIYSQRSMTVEALMEKAKAGNKLAALQVAENFYKSLQYDHAEEWFEKAAGLHYWESRVAAREEKSKDNAESLIKYRDALREAISAEPESFQSLDWRLALAQTFDGKGPEAEKSLNDLLTEANAWIQQPERISQAHAKGFLTEIKDLEISEAYAKMGDAYELMDQPEKYKEAYNKAVDATLKIKPTEKTPTQVIYLIAYMKPVKSLEEIEPWVEKLQKAFPTEFTYVQRHAKLLLEKKQPERALPVAEKAYSKSYGNNKFTSALTLAQVKNELKQKDEARSLIMGLLKSDEAKSPRNKRAVKSLEDYLQKI